jgi:tetraacyldisaccharide 4'-kinase
MNDSALSSQLASAAAALWCRAARLRVGLYRRGLLPTRRLRGKVVSIGNIAWGGTGKTPLTIWLARRLVESGLRVSVLTRGHGRTSPQKVQIIAPGTPPGEARDAGDEVQVYLRHLQGLGVPIGVAASRYDAGTTLEKRFPVQIHLLDDGFQHLKLHRDVDIVLIDAENPWGARGAFRSLLRESPSALERAHAIMLTRCELLTSDNRSSLDDLRKKLRGRNSSAEFFSASTQLIGFRNAVTDVLIPADELRLLRPFAFCGLGNPSAFFRGLANSGVSAVAERVFPDHHRYSASELAALERAANAAGAGCLVTTEKDWVNLRGQPEPNPPLYWAEIDLAIGLASNGDSHFLKWLNTRLELDAAVSPTPAGIRRDPASPSEKLSQGMLSESELHRS